MDDPISSKRQRVAVGVDQAGDAELFVEVVGIALGGLELERCRVLDGLAADSDQVDQAGHRAVDLERGIAGSGEGGAAGAAVGDDLLEYDVAAGDWSRLLAARAGHGLELVLLAVGEGDGYVLGFGRLQAILRDDGLSDRLVPQLTDRAGLLYADVGQG